MNNPTCPQCDCVAGCQANPALCPNVAQPLQPEPITHADWYAKCNMVEALQDKVFALNAMREAQDEIVVHLREAYAQAIAQPVHLWVLPQITHVSSSSAAIETVAQPEQAVNQTDIDHIFETIHDHGNGKYQGAVSKAQRDKAIAICEALGQSIAQPEKTNPAPGYCKSCKEYTIEEPMVAQPEQNAAANKTLSTLIYRIKNLNDNRLLQWELTDTFTEYQAAVAQPKAHP